MATTTTMIHSASPDRLCLLESVSSVDDSSSAASSYSSPTGWPECGSTTVAPVSSVDIEPHASGPMVEWSGGSQGGDQLLDTLVAALEGVLAQHRALGLIVELEVHPIGRVVAFALFRPLDELAAKAGPCGLRRHVDRGVDVGVGAHALDHPVVLELVERAALARDVVVLQVEQLHACVTEGQFVARSERIEEPILDDPVDLAIELERIVLDGADAVLPHLQRPLLERWEAFGLRVTLRSVEVLTLDVQRADLAPVGEANLASTGHVVADVANRPDRVLQRHVAQHNRRIFEHSQHARGGTDLDEGRVLAHVRVPDDDVQAAIPLGVGVGLVAGVDDRTTARRRRADTFPDVLGALGDRVHRTAGRLQDLAGPGEDLPADEEWDQHLCVVAEIVGPAREVVLVAPVAVAGRIRVVLEEIDRAADALLAKPLLGRDQKAFEDALPGLVVHDEVIQRIALGRGVLGVRTDVEVQT